VLTHGDTIRLGQAGDTEIVFFVDDEAPSVERSAILRGHRAAADGRAARRAARARIGPRARRSARRSVLDSAIEVTGAERGFIMLATAEAARVQARARARQGHAVGPHLRDEPQDSRERVRTGQQTIVEDLLDGDLAQLHTGTVALGIRHVLCTPLRLVRYVERAEQKGAEEIIGVLYLDSRERGALRSASSVAALDTLSAEAALAIENARLYREALDKAKFEQELKGRGVDSAGAAARWESSRRVLLGGGGVGRLPRGGRRLLRLRRPADGGFGFIVGDVAARDRRRHCSRRPSSACSARRPPIRRPRRR
jgi:GAF domain-containing protein